MVYLIGFTEAFNHILFSASVDGHLKKTVKGNLSVMSFI